MNEKLVRKHDPNASISTAVWGLPKRLNSIFHVLYQRTRGKFATFPFNNNIYFLFIYLFIFKKQYLIHTKQNFTLLERLTTMCVLSFSRQVRFLTPVYHVNVSPTTGNVCLGFLTEENWLPTRCVRDVLSGVFSLLIKPEPENSADQSVLETYNHWKAVYEEKARKSAMHAR